MDAIPYEVGSYYIFNRSYNDYARLYAIHMRGATFIVRAKKTSNTNVSPGNAERNLMCCLTARYALQVTTNKMTIPASCVSSVTGMRRPTRVFVPHK